MAGANVPRKKSCILDDYYVRDLGILRVCLNVPRPVRQQALSYKTNFVNITARSKVIR